MKFIPMKFIEVVLRVRVEAVGTAEETGEYVREQFRKDSSLLNKDGEEMAKTIVVVTAQEI